MDGFYGIGALLSTVLVGIILTKFGKASYLMFCYAVAGFALTSPVMANIYLAGIAYFVWVYTIILLALSYVQYLWKAYQTPSWAGCKQY